MLFLLSPAKTLDFDAQPKYITSSVPIFLKESTDLIDTLRGYSPSQLSTLMNLSEALAQLNVARYASWKKSRSVKINSGAKQACYAFKGDVYLGLDAEQFNQRDLQYAQRQLRILSGLYGYLKPLDIINPHRLEMGTRLSTDRGKDLYEFWGEKITNAINSDLAEFKDNVVINLASNEYFKAVRKNHLNAEVITPVFKDKKSGKYKVISFYAKKARGMMAAYAIQKKLKKADDLKAFSADGYHYSEPLSTEKEWVFCREAPT